MAARDHLAVEQHLAAWIERHDRYGPTLTQCFSELQVCHDIGQSMSIPRWAYDQTAKSNGMVWVREAELWLLGEGWQRLLAG